MIILVLVGVAFLTLFERKILGFIQNRKGPNKVGALGWLQPLGDAIKLFIKEGVVIFKSNYIIYYLCPLFLILRIFLVWLVLPWVTNLFCINYSMILMVVILRFLGYMILLLRWGSNSMFSLIGSMRFVAQTISYEVRFVLILYVLIILRERYSLKDLLIWQMWIWNGLMLLPVFLIFFIRRLAEINRTPIDLIEGESELVSGFNVEYFRVGFALIFMGEYGIVMFFRFLIVLMFTNLMFFSGGLILGFIIFLRIIVCLRGLLPRIRYDELMYLCWKIILPVILSYLVYTFGLKFFFGRVI